jgi:hypothetical protein
MSASIFPDANVGGIAVLDANGNPTGATGLVNAYIPPTTFSVNATLRYYGTDCTIVRFDPTVINGLSSEMLCFAAAINPAGAWDVNSNCNLSSLFIAWTKSSSSTGLLGIIDAEIAAWMIKNFKISNYLKADRGIQFTGAGYIESDLGTGVRPLLT